MALKSTEMESGTVIYDAERDMFLLKTVNGWVGYLPDTRGGTADMDREIPNEQVVGTVPT